MRSNLKNTHRDSIFGMHIHMIFLTNIGYCILTTNNIRGHQRSLEVQKRSNLKNVPRDTIFGMKSHMIFLTHISYGILTQTLLEVTAGHWR